MANRAAPYTKADVTRALKGVKAAGLQVREIVCSAEGVRLVIGDNDANPELANDFDKWKSNHARSA